MIRLAATVLALFASGVASAQAYRCVVPQRLDRPRAELPGASEPSRIVPIGGYTLAITWVPQFCHDSGGKPAARVECGSGNRFGFALHGLWPDGVASEWPQYCRSSALLPPAIIRRNICYTPSAQLIQHEWAKHGTCMPGYTPARYFRQSTGLYRRLRYPDMDALSRDTPTAGALAAAIAAVNPGLSATMMRVTATKQGWLDEVWLCLDRSFAYARCRPGSGGLAPNAPVKIWRGSK